MAQNQEPVIYEDAQGMFTVRSLVESVSMGELSRFKIHVSIHKDDYISAHEPLVIFFNQKLIDAMPVCYKSVNSEMVKVEQECDRQYGLFLSEISKTAEKIFGTGVFQSVVSREKEKYFQELDVLLDSLKDIHFSQNRKINEQFREQYEKNIEKLKEVAQAISTEEEYNDPKMMDSLFKELEVRTKSLERFTSGTQFTLYLEPNFSSLDLRKLLLEIELIAADYRQGEVPDSDLSITRFTSFRQHMYRDQSEYVSSTDPALTEELKRFANSSRIYFQLKAAFVNDFFFFKSSSKCTSSFM